MTTGLFDGAGEVALQGACVALPAVILTIDMAVAKKRGRFDFDLGKSASYWIIAGISIMFAVFIGVLNGLGSGASLLFRVFIGILIWNGARTIAAESKCPDWQAYSWALGAALFLGALAADNLGTHRDDTDRDPMFGGGETVVDFTPTAQERTRRGLFIFTAVAIPALVGTHIGLNTRLSAKHARK